MKLQAVLLAILCSLMAVNAFAVGPASVAISDRSLWPDALTSQAAFDRASRAEILVFSAALAELSNLDEAALKEQLHIKSADKASVTKVQNYLYTILVGNYKIASRSCHDNEPFCEKADSAASLTSAGQNLAAHLPDPYRAWYENAVIFHRTYAKEQIRLAALFPKISSEIDRYNDNERNGFELGDGHFQLTFDDGPTAKGGNSDKLLKLLHEHHLHAMFFMLGDQLEQRIATQDKTELHGLYDGQCVALHGWHHFSHQKWDKWQSSVLDTKQLVSDTFPENFRPYFRPPYGQRRSDSGPFFKENHLTVAMWNIDSQDWNSKISAEEAANRTLSLMLLWRRGVFLFHDIHPKAQTAVPWLLQKTEGSGIIWDDCHHY